MSSHSPFGLQRHSGTRTAPDPTPLKVVAERSTDAPRPDLSTVTEVLDGHPEAVMLVDDQYRVLWTNAAFETLSGHPPESTRGLQVQTLLSAPEGCTTGQWHGLSPLPSDLPERLVDQDRTLRHMTGLSIQVSATSWPLSLVDQGCCRVLMLRDQSALNRLARAQRRIFDVLTDQALSTEERVDALLTLGCEALCMPIGVVTRLQNDRLKVLHSRSTLTRPLDGTVYGAAHCDCGIVLDLPGPFENHTPEGSSRPHPLVPGMGLRSFAGVRLPLGNAVMGTLCFLNPLPRLDHTPEERGLLADLARAVAQVLAQDLRMQALERAATEDWLTGAATNRMFRKDLSTVFQMVRRNGSTASLIFLDIDHFKSINDSHGHDMGDRVLAEVSTLIQDMLGSQARFYRVGGEEFAILLPGTGGDSAAVLAEQLREHIANQSAKWLELPELTASFGVAELDHDVGTPEAWVKCADIALYASKNAGRNRVTSNRRIDGLEMPEDFEARDGGKYHRIGKSPCGI